LLTRGLSVIVDATNLKEEHRKPFYAMARAHGARLLLVRTWAPLPVIRRRLEGRSMAEQAHDRSTATMEVYQRMREGAERVTRRHVSINTSQPLELALDRILRQLQS
jgi:predicted kinase